MTEFKRGMVAGALIALGAVLLCALFFLAGRDVERRSAIQVECKR